MEYLMRLLRRNRYIHFAMEDEFDTFHDQYPVLHNVAIIKRHFRKVRQRIG